MIVSLILWKNRWNAPSSIFFQVNVALQDVIVELGKAIIIQEEEERFDDTGDTLYLVQAGDVALNKVIFDKNQVVY